MMNNGIKSMANYVNNYPPHINAIQKMVTQVITIPYQHVTCYSFFSKHFVLPLFSFHTMPLAYISTLCFHSSFFLGLQPTLFSFSLQALGLSLFFTMQHAFSNHTTIQEQWKCKYMLWMHVSKLVKVEEKKVMAQRGETTDIFVG